MRLGQNVIRHKDGLVVCLAVVLFSIALVISQAQKVSAHYVYRQGQLYWSGSDDCVWGRSEVSHGNRNGYSRADIRVQRYDSTTQNSCYKEFSRPTGYIRMRMALMYWTSRWNTCRDTGYLYNSSTRSYMTITRTYSSVCGGRNYDTQSWIHELNGSWKGGILWSGSHWLPV